MRKAVTKLSFIGGSLRPKGDIVEVDETIFTPREKRKGEKAEEAANSNLVDVGKGVSQAIVAIAPIAPTGPNPTRPQQLPAGTTETLRGFTDTTGAKLVAAGSELAAVEQGETTADVIEEEGAKSAFDHDGDGKEGGSKSGADSTASKGAAKKKG